MAAGAAGAHPRSEPHEKSADCDHWQRRGDRDRWPLSKEEKVQQRSRQESDNKRGIGRDFGALYQPADDPADSGNPAIE